MYDILAIQRAMNQAGKPAAGGNEYVFDCIFCAKEDHLYVNPDRGMYHCFRCGAGGTVPYLFRKLGFDIPQEAVPRTETVQQLRTRLLQLEEPPPYQITKAGLPEDYWPILPDTAPEQYLLHRGLTQQEIQFYRIGYGMDKLAGRVIVPAFDDEGECLIWAARDYTDSQTLRYMTPKGVSRSDFVPFLSIAKAHPTVIICEGVFSAIAAGTNAVATFGKDFSRGQVNMLLNAKFQGYYVAYDGDALDRAMQLAQALFRGGVTVFLVPIPFGHDPDSLGRQEFQRILSQSIPFTEEAALRLRFNQLL